jgi:ribonuclease-3
VVECFVADLDLLPSVAEPRKTLHEWCQKTHGAPPTYSVTDETGPAHSRVFTITVFCGGEERGKGTGPSKKVATIEAARSALVHLALI